MKDDEWDLNEGSERKKMIEDNFKRWMRGSESLLNAWMNGRSKYTWMETNEGPTRWDENIFLFEKELEMNETSLRTNLVIS